MTRISSGMNPFDTVAAPADGIGKASFVVMMGSCDDKVAIEGEVTGVDGPIEPMIQCLVMGSLTGDDIEGNKGRVKGDDGSGCCFDFV